MDTLASPTPAKTRRLARPAPWLALAALIAFYFLCGRPLYSLYDEEGGPYYLTAQAADLDLDGDLDVLVHNIRNPMEFLAWSGGAIWTNQGYAQGGVPGKFEYRLNELEGGRASVLADLDGDGDQDVTIYDGGALRVGMNLGGVQSGQPGIFRLLSVIREPETQVGQYGVMAAGDLDGDGRTDVLVLGRGQAYDTTPDRSYRPNVSWVWWNNLEIHGVFQARTSLIPALEGLSVAQAALADVDQDGDLDLLAAASPTEGKSMLGSAVTLFLNDGAGNFSDSGQRLPARDASSLAVGDLDGDGDPDVLAGYRSGGLVWINQGGAQAGQAGAFAAAPAGLDGRKIRGVALADLDGDGDLDALVAGGKQAELWWNDGSGIFTRSGQSFPCRDDQNLATGDFNNDGKQDIFITQYDDRAQVWWNSGQGSFQTLPGQP